MEDTNVSSIIGIINNAIKTNYTIPVQLVSKGKEVKFKTLNISQQKKILSAAIKQNVYDSDFITAFYEILKDNYNSEDILPLNDLDIFDKLLISLTLRASVNPNYVFAGTATTINLNDILSSIANNISTISHAPKVISQNGIEIYCQLPSIESEAKCESSRLNTSAEDMSEQLQHIVAESVTNELTKFAKKIVIDSNVIILDDFSFNERKNIIEQLPAFVLEQTLNYVLTYKKTIDSLLSFTVVLPDGKTEVKTLQINGSFFATM